MASSRKHLPSRGAPPQVAQRKGSAKKAPPPPPVEEISDDGFMAAPQTQPRPPLPSSTNGKARESNPPVAGIVALLQVIQGPEGEGALSLATGGTYTIGRGRENDLVLRDIVASRRHMQLSVNGKTVKLADLGSGNGTRVNGKKIKEVVLKDGDHVEVGNTVMQFTQSANVKVMPQPPRANKTVGPWMDARTVGGGEAEQLRKEFLEESLRAETRALGSASAQPLMQRAPTQPRIKESTERRTKGGKPATPPPDAAPTIRGKGTTSVGVSRNTVIIVLLVAMAVMLVALSVTVAVLFTRGTNNPPAPVPTPQNTPAPSPAPAPAPAPVNTAALVDRAMQLEAQGKSDAADEMLNAVKDENPAEYETARRRLETLRASKKARERSDPPEQNQASSPPPERTPREERRPDPAPREDPPPQRRDPPPQQHRPAAQKPAAKPASKPAAKPAGKKRMSAADASDLLQKASDLAKDDRVKDAIRLLKQVLDQCDDDEIQRKAEGRLTRYQKKLEEG